jgi:butyrate kinase
MSLIREWANFFSHSALLCAGEHETDSVAERASRALRNGEVPKQYK